MVTIAAEAPFLDSQKHSLSRQFFWLIWQAFSPVCEWILFNLLRHPNKVKATLTYFPRKTESVSNGQGKRCSYETLSDKEWDIYTHKRRPLFLGEQWERKLVTQRAEANSCLVSQLETSTHSEGVWSSLGMACLETKQPGWKKSPEHLPLFHSLLSVALMDRTLIVQVEGDWSSRHGCIWNTSVPCPLNSRGSSVQCVPASPPTQTWTVIESLLLIMEPDSPSLCSLSYEAI